MSEQLKKATFGGGCFWCIEAVFQRLSGVDSVVSGYSGGEVPNPTYEQVCSGNSGHAEVIQITYDPDVISFADLLEVFFKTHDPTTLNRQGADRGTQYRSVIFSHDDEQRLVAEQYMKQLDESKVFPSPIVTEVSPATEFFHAEDYHQDYFNQNGVQTYCTFVIAPKIEKFQQAFPDKLKSDG